MNNNLPAIDVSSKLAYFQPGMYVVRLAEDAPGNVVMLSSSPVGRGTVDFFPGDGVLRNTLSKVGDCVVLRVKSAASSLLITEFHKDGQQKKIILKIDRIGTLGHLEAVADHSIAAVAASGAQVAAQAPSEAQQHVARAAQVQQPLQQPLQQQPQQQQPQQQQPQQQQPQQHPQPTGAADIVVRKMAHIEGVGDIVSQAGWLGDPTSYARLEGFAVSPVGLPAGVQLNYGVLVQGAQRYASAVAGQFVGTRQKAKALVGVVFELTGPLAQKFRLSGQVVFAGQPPLAIEPGVPMSGPSGTEHLVALHLSIAPQAPQSTAASAWDDPTVTRITRSTPAAAQKAAVKKAPAKKAPAKKAAAKKGTTTRSKK